MRNLFLFLTLLCAFGISNAQGQTEFLFADNLKDTVRLKIDYSDVGTNVFGPEVARKMHLLQQTYTFVEKGTVINPGDKTIVRKPDIYYSVKKIYKFYKKQVKKGLITESDAAKNMVIIINKSFSILYEDTSDFENHLRTLKKPEELEKVFLNLKLY